MYSVKLKCRVITPMFMAGADGRTPELRPSEFKGMMRFWWRAIKADDDIEKLKKEEAEIFGGSGEGQGRSKVRIRIYPLQIRDMIGGDIRSEINGYEGLKYLFYSTYSLRSRGQPIIRQYIKPDFEFFVEINSLNEYVYKNALASLWASIYLGGFGTRARRGGGNIAIVSCTGDIEEIDFITPTPSGNDNLHDWFKKNIEKIREIINQSSGTNKYTNMKNGNILIFNPKKSWKDALNFIGEKFKNFRSNNKNKIFETPAFGMPVMHNRFSVRMVPYEKDRRLSDRWASPLILKVIMSNNGLYFPMIVKLSTGGIKWIGKEIKQNNEWKLENDQKRQFNEELIGEFINTFKEAKKWEIVL